MTAAPAQTPGTRRPPRPRGRARWAGPLGLHHPGRSWLHRAPTGAKLLGLAVVGVAVLVVGGAWPSLVLLLAAVALVASARVPWRATLRATAPVLAVAVVVGGYQWWRRGPDVAVEVAADLLTVVVAAVAVTATTAPDRLLDALVRVARPLRVVGLHPDTVALAVGLMLRAVPALVDASLEARDAARARGLERDPRAVLVPAAVRAVGRARRTGDALAARGLVD